MTDLNLSAEQAERLRYLAHVAFSDLSAFGPTQGRQIIMLAALADGLQGKEIAARLGAKPSMVSNFKAKIAQKGVEAFLRKWEGALKQHTEEMDTSPKGRGAIDSIDKWLDSHSADGEPVFEIAELVIDAGGNLAIFAVRDRKEESKEPAVSYQSFVENVRAVYRDPILAPIPWTKICTFDANFSALLEDLAAKHATLEISTWKEDVANPLPDLRKTFGAGYEFFLLVQGDMAERNVERWSQMARSTEELRNPGNVLHAANADEFFARFGSVIYRLRERFSCAGLCPSHPFLSVFVKKWAMTTQGELLCYTCDARRFDQSLNHAALLWRYPAFFGGLFHMNRRLWSRLPWREDFSFDVSKLRPRITCEPLPVGQSGLSMMVEMLPGANIVLHSPTEHYYAWDLKKKTQETRTRLRQKGVTARFFYSTTPWNIEGWKRFFSPDFDGDMQDMVGRISAALVPRHFLATHDLSAADLTKLGILAKQLQEGVFAEKHDIVDDQREPCLVFHAPSLLAGIRRAYEQNLYGDRIWELERDLQRSAEDLKGEGKDYQLKVMGVAQLHFFHPSYWCLHPVSNPADGSDAGRWNVLMAKQEAAAKDSFWFGFDPPLIPPPADSIERGFKDLLRDLDADFLHSYLLPKDRADADRMAELWINQVRALVSPLYDVDTRDGKNRAIALVDPERKKQAAARKSELKSWIYDDLEVFVGRNRRIVRKAIEIVQRCSLAGLEPVPLVVESKKSLLKRWRSFLSKRLKARLFRRSKAGDLALDDGSYEIELHEVQELVELVRALVKRPDDLNAAKSFAVEAVDGDMMVWRDVLGEIAQLENGAEIRAAVEQGLNLYRTNADNSSPESKLSKLRERFARIGNSGKLPVKPPTRPNEGG